MRIKRMALLAMLLAATACAEGLPVFFIPNRGQAPAAVRFMVKGSGLTAGFLRGEIDFEIAGAGLRMRFAGSSAGQTIEGRGPLGGRANFLTGRESSWRRDIPVYRSVVYRGLYPGIDMVYGGDGGLLKSEFVVGPGADPGRIRVLYEGGGAPWVDDDGSLVVRVGERELREQAPVVYQDGQKIGGRFVVLDDGAVGFEIGAYDVTRALVIDPVLSYSSLISGSGVDYATAIAVDGSGSAYLAGYTSSYNFPLTNAAQSFNAGGTDAFVAKLNWAGNGLVYCTYLGGSNDDRAFGIAVDAQGNAYVAGATSSSNFPVRGALQGKIAGARNAFVTKLNAAGNGLVYSTYLGGNASDAANGIAVNAAGEAYIAGDTTSFSFPAGGFQRGIRGGQDAFVAKLSADGARLVYSTYLGGSADDHGAAVAVDGSGTAFVTGSTYSTDFPVQNAAQPSNGGGQDAFVARFSADGSYLVYSTYLGGSGGTAAYPEMATAIAVDAQANAYVAGVTSSADFPGLNAVQTARRGMTDAFAAKLSAAGVLSYSTYLGGSSVEQATGIAVDGSGNAFITGYTYSTDLAVTAALQGTNAGEYDAFLAELNPRGDTILYLGYIGGNSSDAAMGVALDAVGNAYVAGYTLSTNFPLLNSYQQVNTGNFGAFVTKLVFSVTPTNGGVTPAAGNGAGQVFSLQYSDPGGAANLTTVGVLIGATAGTSGSCVVSYDRARNALSLLGDAGQVSGATIAPGAGTLQNSQCSVNGAGSSATASGLTLTLNVAVTFLPGFAGAKNVYMQAASAIASTGWQAKGAWTVSFAASAVSVAPASGSGNQQSFVIQFGDEAGAGDLSTVSVLINGTATTAGACAVTYNRAANTLALLTDAGQPAATIAPGSGTLQNSQCTVSGVGSSVTASGQSLTLTLTVGFLPGFSGAKNVYLQAVSPFSSTGWVARGTWMVSFGVATVSVAPASGSGSQQTFAFVFSDEAGAADLSTASVLFNAAATATSGCAVTYDRAANTLALLTDSGQSPGSAITPGTGSQQNSQCVLNGGGSSVAVAGQTLTLNLSLTFLPAFAGAKDIYMQATASIAQSVQSNVFTPSASPRTRPRGFPRPSPDPVRKRSSR